MPRHTHRPPTPYYHVPLREGKSQSVKLISLKRNDRRMAKPTLVKNGQNYAEQLRLWKLKYSWNVVCTKTTRAKRRVI